MCLAVPLQVKAVRPPGLALCSAPDAPDRVRPVDIALLEHTPAVGDWLLTHVDVALRSLAPEEARQIGDALLAVSAAAAGLPFEHLLGDLLDREPTLPPHLAQQAAAENRS